MCNKLQHISEKMTSMTTAPSCYQPSHVSIYRKCYFVVWMNYPTLDSESMEQRKRDLFYFANKWEPREKNFCIEFEILNSSILADRAFVPVRNILWNTSIQGLIALLIDKLNIPIVFQTHCIKRSLFDWRTHRRRIHPKMNMYQDVWRMSSCLIC